ncbi:Embryonic polyadenylate-binding protein [Frankliniella fusca]|uniref:Embryonic polyadenylate-binding protein n=1 Tax=Frankliniella fusca TaxID=407009 RepID=A0AAE1H526_9NEOP|nr:Embryonic polyadenylate-binding protein [Frankliniella fusca]
MKYNSLKVNARMHARGGGRRCYCGPVTGTADAPRHHRAASSTQPPYPNVQAQRLDSSPQPALAPSLQPPGFQPPGVQPSGFSPKPSAPSLQLPAFSPHSLQPPSLQPPALSLQPQSSAPSLIQPLVCMSRNTNNRPPILRAISRKKNE